MKKLAITMMCLATVVVMQARQETLLSEGWQFTRDGAKWETVSVPHDWAISGPFDKKWDLQVVAIKENGEDVATEHSGRSGALPWIGQGTYRRSIAIPAGTERAELLFDGAMASPKVYVNGQYAGGWEYGYNAFRVDIMPYVRVGSADNQIEVRLENLEESNRWYPGAGLYRPVTLITTGLDAFDQWGLCVRSYAKHGSSDEYVVEVQQELAQGLDADGYEMSFDVLDADGRIVASGRSAANGVGAFKDVTTLKAPHLWSPESPYLYRIVTKLLKNGQQVDEKSSRFGVRTITFSPEYGFQLNGVSRKFKGVCLHHDLGPLGAAVNKTALIRQIKMMKQMGADAIRTSHNMPSTWQMEICDSLGMMVMAESFDAWSDAKVRNGYNRLWNEWWRRDITNLIRNHRNHPCIVMWSVGNEIPEQWKPEGAERYKRLIELCHRLDPTRPVTCGMDQPDGDISSGFAQIADVPGYNYRVARYEETFPKLPQGFLLGSETASTVSTRGHYYFPDEPGTNKQWPDGQCSGYDTEYCWWSNLPDDDWHMQDDFPWTIGEFVWTGYDYLGEPTPYDTYWPSRSSYFGIVDLAGLPKDRYWLYRSHWNHNEHTLHVLPHWTWPGREGQTTPVYCYTDYPSAELFVNGKSQGRITKDPASRLDRFRLRWRDVKYAPGEIKVVAYDENGNKAAEEVLRTAGKPTKLALDPERAVINADGNDLAFVTVSLVDKNGTLCPDANDQLTFTVKGAGSFKAVCNGDATSTETFTQPTMKLFHGQLVVVLQAGKQAGPLTLTVADRKAGIKESVTLQVR